MTPVDLVISRIINFGNQSFKQDDVCYSEHGIGKETLKSAFKRINAKRGVERVVNDAHKVPFYRMNRYHLRKYMENSRGSYKGSLSFTTSPWESVWPDFFKKPDLKGKARLVKSMEV